VSKKRPDPVVDIDTLNSITKRAHYFAVQMIQLANHRADKEKGDPKIGGHPAACASSIHLLGALHLYLKSGFDHMAVKPHASPADHSFNYLLDLLLDSDLHKLSPELCEKAMHGLRAYSQNGEPVFQSYHSRYDSDHHNFLPSGTVGIPPVNLGYLALAYAYAKDHGFEVPEAHFWALIGDSEFREGSLFEAMTDFAEREIGNLTWIIDYNRQSLDGHRMVNKEIMNGNDNVRIGKTAEANGWEVIELQHGSFRKELFKKPGGEEFKNFLENDIVDFELQALMLSQDPKAIRKEILKTQPKLDKFLKSISDQEMQRALKDFGGHDYHEIIAALEKSKENKRRPCIVIAHTLKGWNLEMAAQTTNHSALPAQEEVDQLRESNGLKADELFGKFSENSKEGKYLKARGEKIYAEILEQHAIKNRNLENIRQKLKDLPDSLGINLKLVNFPHTQWMLGQLTAKLTRIANDTTVKPEEVPFRLPGELLISMAPDVGTSTNLNPAMDGKIFGAIEIEDYENELNVKDRKAPDLIPGEDKSDRFLRFEIAECNAMSCVGSLGQMRDLLGIPLIPLMTVYDFFIKRALDQYFYNLYWKSSFLLVGTPAGVTLSPEGAQHGWKSDFQIPNQITWEPFFCQELDWIIVDSIKRHLFFDNEERTGTLIRGSTRGVDQKHLMTNLKKQARFKTETPLLCPDGWTVDGATPESSVATITDEAILSQLRTDVLNGGYYLIDYRGYAGYEPGDNVVHIFAMGSPTTEAIAASETLLSKGVYANVIVVTSSDLLIGNLADQNGYHHLRNTLGIDSTIFFQPYHNGNGADRADLLTLAGRRIPIVSVHDGEPGLLDNIGSIIGVRHETLAVRKHSKCGRPSDVYAYHGIDASTIVETVGKVLSETALEKVQVSSRVLAETATQSTSPVANWRELWPNTPEKN
jgi:pyruvate dehydrogenase E1 component